MSNIKVSIIIPVYNVEKYIEKCLESAINQTLDEIELIIVNDGSTDDSLKIINKYSENNKITVINQENRGLSEARNVGLKVAKGEYIYFLDSDDYISFNLAEELYNIAKFNNLDIIHFNAEAFYDDDIDTKNKDMYERNDVFNNVIYNGKEFFKIAINKNGFKSPVWLYFYKRSFLNENGLTFYSGILHEDELFSTQSLILAERVLFINKSYFFRRVRKGSIMTTSKSMKNIIGYYTVAEQLYKFYKEHKSILDESTKRLLLVSISEYYGNCIHIFYNLKNKDKKMKNEIRVIIKSLKDKKDVYNINNKKILLKVNLPRTYTFYMNLKWKKK